ncbi:cysteine hydrolase family protein [Thermosulfurimonas sp. F29]|uniref:cysteine hydrolase family protein n=1 Tax=Thermosulfurimonas sp. F29 TaxID=2867247 RepID=UPI001C82E1C2|nr:isochorismatase family cysteine hydrolase [Thermosulfurimonas sp. F29]MBX6422418.1 cysteine hydrolase [Thermosulfurimonas sp. F29]
MRALIVIDMLNDFVDPKGVLYCGETARRIIPRVKELVEEFRARGEPVIFVCDAHAPDDAEFAAFPAHCVRGTWGAEVVPDLAPGEGDRVIEKTRFDAFFRTELEEVLRELRVEEVWLCGVCTSICVMDTAAGAFFRGFRVVVPGDAVADFDPEAHAFALKRMERIYKAEIR